MKEKLQKIIDNKHKFKPTKKFNGLHYKNVVLYFYEYFPTKKSSLAITIYLKPLFFGYRRLKSIDLSEKEHKLFIKEFKKIAKELEKKEEKYLEIQNNKIINKIKI